MDSGITTRPYRLTLGDFVAFYLRTYFSMFFIWPIALLWWSGLLSAIVLAIPKARPFHIDQAFLLAALPLPVILLIILPLIGLTGAWRSFSKNGMNAKERVLSITDDKVIIRGESLDAELDWSNFIKAVKSQRNVFLYTSPGCAHIIPRAAFADDSAFERFAKTARQHIANVRHKQVRVFYGEDADKSPSGIYCVSYRMTFGIYLRMYLRNFYMSMTRPLSLLGLVVGVFAGPLWINRDALLSGDLRLFPILFGIPLIGLVLILSVVPFAACLVTWPRQKKQAKFMSERHMNLTDQGVRSYGDAHDILLQWKDLHGVGTHFGLLLFMTSPVAAVALPISAFPDRAAATAFAEEATRRWRAAKSGLDGRA